MRPRPCPSDRPKKDDKLWGFSKRTTYITDSSDWQCIICRKSAACRDESLLSNFPNYGWNSCYISPKEDETISTALIHNNNELSLILEFEDSKGVPLLGWLYVPCPCRWSFKEMESDFASIFNSIDNHDYDLQNVVEIFMTP